MERYGKKTIKNLFDCSEIDRLENKELLQNYIKINHSRKSYSKTPYMTGRDSRKHGLRHWPTFWPSVDVTCWRTLAYLWLTQSVFLQILTQLHECGRVVKPEGWGARDQSSIPDVGSLQNTDLHRRIFEVDARSLNHDVDIK